MKGLDDVSVELPAGHFSAIMGPSGSGKSTPALPGQVLSASGEGISTFAAPPGQLVTVLAVGAFAGVAAGFRPARRAAKLNILAAIATE